MGINFTYAPIDYDFYYSPKASVEPTLSGELATVFVTNVEIWENRYLTLTWNIINKNLKNVIDNIEFFRYYTFYDGEYGHSWTVFCVKKDIKPLFTNKSGEVIFTGTITLKKVT